MFMMISALFVDPESFWSKNEIRKVKSQVYMYTFTMKSAFSVVFGDSNNFFEWINKVMKNDRFARDVAMSY